MKRRLICSAAQTAAQSWLRGSSGVVGQDPLDGHAVLVPEPLGGAVQERRAGRALLIGRTSA
jgi:hypothetical protein